MNQESLILRDEEEILEFRRILVAIKIANKKQEQQIKDNIGKINDMLHTIDKQLARSVK